MNLSEQQQIFTFRKEKSTWNFSNDEVYQYCWLQKQWLQFIVCDVDILFDPLTVTRAPRGGVNVGSVRGWAESNGNNSGL